MRKDLRPIYKVTQEMSSRMVNSVSVTNRKYYLREKLECKVPPTDQYTHKMEYYLAIKKKEILTHLDES